MLKVKKIVLAQRLLDHFAVVLVLVLV